MFECNGETVWRSVSRSRWPKTLDIVDSESANGTRGFQEWVIAFHGAALRPPQSPNYYPAKSVVEWHVREVFQGPERCNAPA
jgi:putative restriction endonuclease